LATIVVDFEGETQQSAQPAALALVPGQPLVDQADRRQERSLIDHDYVLPER
jgi:hypothetical protein